MSQVVVDASVAVKWRIEEILSPEARFLLFRWETAGIEMIVPGWFACEIANVLYQRCRQNALTRIDAVEIHQEIMKPIATRDFPSSLGVRAMIVAFEAQQRASYDAHYVALAEHLNCDLWTADERFWRATHDAFPFVKWIGNVVIKDSG